MQRGRNRLDRQPPGIVRVTHRAFQHASAYNTMCERVNAHIRSWIRSFRDWHVLTIPISTDTDTTTDWNGARVVRHSGLLPQGATELLMDESEDMYSLASQQRGTRCRGEHLESSKIDEDGRLP